MPLFTPFRSLSFLSLCAPLLVISCGDESSLKPRPTLSADELMTLEAIFEEDVYDAEEPGKIKWLADGSGYTTLETNPAYEEAEPELDEEGEERCE